MTADQAKAAADLLAGTWEHEANTTAQVLGAVSRGNRDYKPDPKSRSSWELATHIATADYWFLDCIINGAFAFDPEAAKAAEAKFKTAEDLVSFYKTAIPEKLKALRALPAEKLAEPLAFFNVMTMPRANFVAMANNHSIHHRGQLAAYLRAMGSKVPNIYGPSADAEPAGAGN